MSATRLATPSDSFPSGGAWTPAQLAAEVGKPGTALFVGEGGYALFKLVGDEARLVDVLVQERGKGNGRRLLQSAFSQLQAKLVTLEVSEKNAAARALYERLGFRVVGRRAKFYNDGSDALLMDLHL